MDLASIDHLQPTTPVLTACLMRHQLSEALTSELEYLNALSWTAHVNGDLRTSSPSSTTTDSPRSRSATASPFAIEVLPAPLRPVNQTVFGEYGV